MRLSCTITGQEGPSAIIKYRGRSHVLVVGDQVQKSGYRVESIGVNRVVLKRGVERMKLETERAPDTIAEEERMFGVEGMQMPVVEVKQVPIGNN